jgi:hypothetical protein
MKKIRVIAYSFRKGNLDFCLPFAIELDHRRATAGRIVLTATGA